MSHPTSGLSPEQKTLRKQGLGASEVAAVLGLDPYRTALDVFLEKTGQSEPFEGNRFTHWGNRLEPLIADEYGTRHPDIILSDGVTTVGPEPWMLATPDRIANVLPLGSGERYGLECKCRSAYQHGAWGEEGSDEIPHAVAVQCHWGMIVTGLKRWDIVVLLGGNDYREYTVHFDETLAAGLVSQARAFWFDYVVANVHPPFTGAESDHKFLLRTYPTHTSEVVAATPEIDEAAKLLQVHRSAIDKHEEAKSRLEAQIKEFIADRMGVEGPFGKITWKHMDAVDVKAFTRPAHRRMNTKFAKPLD